MGILFFIIGLVLLYFIGGSFLDKSIFNNNDSATYSAIIVIGAFIVVAVFLIAVTNIR